MTSIPPPLEKAPSATDETGIYRNKLCTELVVDHAVITSDQNVMRIVGELWEKGYHRKFGCVIREEVKERADKRKRGEVHLPHFACTDKPLDLESLGPSTFKATISNGKLRDSFRFMTKDWAQIEKLAQVRLARMAADDKYYRKHGPWYIVDIDVIE